MLIRKKQENLARMKLQTDDKSTEGGTQQASAPALDLKKEERGELNEETEGEPLDFIIDRATGKKMSRKRILMMYQSGAFNSAQVVELEKQGYLSTEATAGDE